MNPATPGNQHSFSSSFSSSSSISATTAGGTASRAQSVIRPIEIAVVIVAVLVALLSNSGLAGAQEASDVTLGGTALVDAVSLNLRESATVDAAIVAELPYGSVVTVLDGPISADGYAWYQVDASGLSGWVVSDHISASAAAAAALSFVAGDSAVVNTDALNLRAAPGTDSETLSVLSAGSAVAVTGEASVLASGTWLSVETDAGSGYVAGEYLAATAVDPVAVSSTASLAGIALGATVIVNDDAVNLRDDASLSGGVVTELALGDTATVLGGPVAADGYGWYRIQTDLTGTTGWVVADELTGDATSI